MVALTLGVVFSLVGASLASYATEGQQKRYIKGAFKQYLSPTIIEELIAHPERLTLGGQKRELSIFFSDLQGFTSISEVLTPEELTQLLNEYLSAMTDIIQEEGGTIDKYEGDAIIAFWNAPLDQADHAGPGGAGGSSLPGAARRAAPRVPRARRRRTFSSASASTPDPPWWATWARRRSSTTPCWGTR